MFDSNLPAPPLLTGTQKQSRIGIAAFVLGIIASLLLCIGFLIAFGYGFTNAMNSPSLDPSTIIDTGSTTILLASGFIYCSPVFSLVGLGLGIAAAVQKRDKKTLGIIGLVLNALILLSFCAIFGLGLIGMAGV
jgi:hypothetical protein